MSTATNTEYSISWTGSGDKESEKSYKTHSTSSTIANTGKPVRLVEVGSENHCHNTTYTVPTNLFHKSEVAADILHATLAFFDSKRGFQQDAAVLRPVGGVSYTAQKDFARITTAALARMVESVRQWDTLFERGLQCDMKTQWEEALQAFVALYMFANVIQIFQIHCNIYTRFYRKSDIFTECLVVMS